MAAPIIHFTLINYHINWMILNRNKGCEHVFCVSFPSRNGNNSNCWEKNKQKKLKMVHQCIQGKFSCKLDSPTILWLPRFTHTSHIYSAWLQVWVLFCFCFVTTGNTFFLFCHSKPFSSHHTLLGKNIQMTLNLTETRVEQLDQRV